MDTNDVYRRLLPGESCNNDHQVPSIAHDNRITMRHSRHSFSRQFSHRAKPSSAVAPCLTSTFAAEYPNARKVQIRLVFIHIGEIDTLNEKYQADIYFEARWIENGMSLNHISLTAEQQTAFFKNSVVKILETNPTLYWSPQLFIENAIAQIGEQEKWLTIKKADSDSTQPSSVKVEICEHRRMKGIFWEKLELSHFPADVQDLTISIASHHQMETCILVPDKKFLSFINREAFTDQQEWALYEHVATEERKTNEEYSFDDDDCGGVEEKNHSVLDVTCRAARRPGYYYWNGFYLIFLITVCSFCIFSIPPNLPQNRLQITCTLLLTSITFRWVVNRSLPQISYLTTLDIYAIISIVILVLLCIWHSIIAASIFYSETVEELGPNNLYTLVDRYVFIGLIITFVVTHLVLFVWLILVPYKRRREMERFDREYSTKRCAQPSSRLGGSKQDLVFRRASSILEIPPNLKATRAFRRSDSGIMIPNGSTFTPIQEISNEASRKALEIIELREPEDKY